MNHALAKGGLMHLFKASQSWIHKPHFVNQPTGPMTNREFEDSKTFRAMSACLDCIG